MTPDRHSLPPPVHDRGDDAPGIAHSEGQPAAQEAGRYTIDARLGLRVRQRSRDAFPAPSTSPTSCAPSHRPSAAAMPVKVHICAQVQGLPSRDQCLLHLSLGQVKLREVAQHDAVGSLVPELHEDGLGFGQPAIAWASSPRSAWTAVKTMRRPARLFSKASPWPPTRPWLARCSHLSRSPSSRIQRESLKPPSPRRGPRARPGDHRWIVEAGLSAPERLSATTVQRRFGRERLISELGGHAL